jgi:anti-sigma regulatory factor (Ser/Thr protein kinase)
MGVTRMSWSLPARAESVPLSRHRVESVLRDCGWDEERIGYVGLMTTELASNAVEHAGTPYTLTIELAPLVLRVDVRDASAALPVMGEMGAPGAMGGRGLALIAELAQRWGCDSVTGGKSVWFEAAPV